MEQALNDLLWMSKRLAGILEIKDEVENYATFKQQIVDMSKQVEDLKSEILDLEASKIQVKTDIDIVLDDARKKEAESIEEAKRIITKAKEDAKVIVSDAHKTAGQKIAEAVNKVHSIEAQEDEASAKLSTVNSALSSAENKLNSIKLELESLKSKF